MVKMLNVNALPNIPWQDRPADLKTESPVWRYRSAGRSCHGILGRALTFSIFTITFSSSVNRKFTSYIGISDFRYTGCPLTTVLPKGSFTPLHRPAMAFTASSIIPSVLTRKVLSSTD